MVPCGGTKSGRLEGALAALEADQIAILEKSVRLVALDLPVIESAGGSARCMIAGLHLARRPN